MDYRPKMVLASQQKFHASDDDDEDLDALRLAALQSLGTKDNSHKKQPLTQLHNVVPQVTQIARPSYKLQRIPKRPHFHNRIQPRQNGIVYYQSHRNPNLIAIVPVEEHPEIQNVEATSAAKEEKTETCTEVKETDESKFHRYKDSRSGSEEDDRKSNTNNLVPVKEESIKTSSVENETVAANQNKENKLEVVDESKKQEEKEEIKNNDDDDDDDVLFMADSEEEDSLERLMDEMEREINVPVEKKDKDSQNQNNKSSLDKNAINETKKNEDNGNRKESNNHATSLTTNVRCEKRSVSPHMTSGNLQKRRSLSPKSRSRKRSPRRSPRRSPLRQVKKSLRETSKYKSPVRRSPYRKLSPRMRSPRLSPHSRSPKLLRSRSPRLLSRSRSPPRTNRSPRITSRSPRHTRSRSPMRLSPRSRSRSRTISPHRLSPSTKRISPRSRSPGYSPRRVSPRRMSPHKISPRRSPWSSPRNSPRLSPRRRKSPRVSPKELSRKRGPCSISPENNLNSIYIRESPPMHKRRSPDSYRDKTKQKEDNFEKIDSSDIKESINNTINDPILEARRRKFESTRPIDPLLDNKKIKLSNNTNKKQEVVERTHSTINIKKINKLTEDDHNIRDRDRDLCLDTSYEFEDLEDTMENSSPIGISSSINSCIIVDSSKTEKEKSSKKKKKRDKEIYQVGKLKSELPLSERIGKDKKCKKRKDISEVQPEEVDAIFEDIAVDEEGDLRAELSRRRAERLNRSAPIQSARLVQSAFKGVVNDVVKNNAKVNQRHVIKNDEKVNQKDVRRVTVVRSVPELHDSGDESNLDSKMPVRFRLGLNKQVQDTRETKVSRKTSKRQNRKE
ncbi:PREDICTED: serine/arginine repetitive matrix protein 1-like isoform X2 [Polistes dominula]|uniref:Serine/arginine repetitive matrix protein 1-like isoform X2 n=1 Tax=Polistes dominula TaxID=743375 RepID=A0ABM1IQV5_POLDO|nr:PREDICTED: serine/arginine repetitive matrix protein 1-like isoform X2 [Polistes dominula]